ncbi:hypothetical protein QQ045_022311 [Rhodiola kirilowii]
MLKRKARLHWLSDGDRNTRFFHTTIKAHRARNLINLKLPDGTFSSDMNLIGNQAVEFYTSLFQGSAPTNVPLEFHLFQKVISDEESRKLSATPDHNDVLNQVKMMNGDSAPGPDEFLGWFYTKCWVIIWDDLMAAINLFFQGFRLPSSISATTLTLIAKVEAATSISQIKPISLCNFCHKIISRILTTRLASLLPKLISEEQVGFVQGRCIHDNICLAHDLTHDLHNKHFGGNVIIKSLSGSFLPPSGPLGSTRHFVTGSLDASPVATTLSNGMESPTGISNPLEAFDKAIRCLPPSLSWQWNSSPSPLTKQPPEGLYGSTTPPQEPPG